MLETHPVPHHSAGGIGCGTDAGGWVGATISWYGDRGVRYVYIAAAQQACRIMGAPRGWCCRRGFASAGFLGRVRRADGC